MNKKTLSGLITASLLSATLAVPAFAHQQGDIIVRAGALMVAPNESSVDVGFGEFTVSDNTQLGLNFTYMATDNIGIELVAATPFKHDVGLDSLGGKIAEVNQLPPTLLAQYYFGDSGSKFRPYVGAGVNFTVFFDTKFNDNGTDKQLTDLDLSNSVGLAAQVGIDYKINEKWLVNASVMYADISTDVTFKLDGNDVKVKTDLDPLVYMVSVGYVF